MTENFLYLDESGDPGNPIDENGKRKLRSSTHFTIGGIIVNSEQKQFFETRHKEILEKYANEHARDGRHSTPVTVLSWSSLLFQMISVLF